jgi:uncharacterized protein YegP (UPF0339 family)
MKVQIYKGSGLQPWRVRLVSVNGEVLASSEGYATRWNAKRAATKMFPGLDVIYTQR